jgi:hypothetical protein
VVLLVLAELVGCLQGSATDQVSAEPSITMLSLKERTVSGEQAAERLGRCALLQSVLMSNLFPLQSSQDAAAILPYLGAIVLDQSGSIEDSDAQLDVELSNLLRSGSATSIHPINVSVSLRVGRDHRL